MFETITQLETAIFFITIGSILMLSSLFVMIIFLRYKELRHGIYGMIIGSTASEVYIGIHLLLNGILGLIFTKDHHLKSFICKFDGFCTVFFFSFWCTQNIFIMFLSFKRKVNNSQFTRFSFFLSLLFSIMISFFSLIRDDLGMSYSDCCFLKEAGISYLSILILFGLILTAAILYNLWFFLFRDTSKDRSFINGYNYFLLITSILFSIFFFNVFVINRSEINSIPFNYIGFISFFLCCLYISFFRIQIEYVQILLSIGPTSSKFLNLLLFLGCCYRKPKFREIRKVLNVRWITQPTGQSNLDDTIYSKILKSTDF